MLPPAPEIQIGIIKYLNPLSSHNLLLLIFLSKPNDITNSFPIPIPTIHILILCDSSVKNFVRALGSPLDRMADLLIRLL